MSKRTKTQIQQNIARIVLFTMLLTFGALIIIGLTGCDDNSTAVTTQQPASSDNIIQIYYHDSLSNPQSYEGPFKNLQYGFEHVFLYRDGYNELKIPVTNVLSINVNPEGR